MRVVAGYIEPSFVVGVAVIEIVEVRIRGRGARQWSRDLV